MACFGKEGRRDLPIIFLRTSNAFFGWTSDEQQRDKARPAGDGPRPWRWVLGFHGRDRLRADEAVGLAVRGGAGADGAALDVRAGVPGPLGGGEPAGVVV